MWIFVSLQVPQMHWGNRNIFWECKLHRIEMVGFDVDSNPNSPIFYSWPWAICCSSISLSFCITPWRWWQNLFYQVVISLLGLPSWLNGKEICLQCRSLRRHGFDSFVRKIPWRRDWQPTLVFLPGESQGQRSLVGSQSPWGHKELDTTEVI